MQNTPQDGQAPPQPGYMAPPSQPMPPSYPAGYPGYPPMPQRPIMPVTTVFVQVPRRRPSWQWLAIFGAIVSVLGTLITLLGFVVMPFTTFANLVSFNAPQSIAYDATGESRVLWIVVIAALAALLVAALGLLGGSFTYVPHVVAGALDFLAGGIIMVLLILAYQAASSDAQQYIGSGYWATIFGGIIIGIGGVVEVFGGIAVALED